MNANEVKLPYTLSLKYPVQMGQEEVTELTFQKRLTGEDIFQLPVNGQVLGDTFRLISKMTLQPISLIKRMDAVDILEAGKVVNSFLPTSQED